MQLATRMGLTAQRKAASYRWTAFFIVMDYWAINSSNVQQWSAMPAACAGVTRISPGRQQKLK